LQLLDIKTSSAKDKELHQVDKELRQIGRIYYEKKANPSNPARASCHNGDIITWKENIFTPRQIEDNISTKKN
jgi:hypothetical protein